ncbi:efflux RND transporter permease subunit [Clostridium sp. DL1XJH146]
MSKISEYSVKKPVTIIMAVLIVIILGVVSLINTTTALLPSFNLPYAVVSTTYIGASPEEVELIVTKSIENSMATVSNIENIQSVSQENMSMVILEFNEDANMDSALIEMRENLDMVTSYMPEEVGNPMVIKVNPDMMPIMNFSMALEGKNTAETSTWVDTILPRIERIPGVASVSLMGDAEEEIRISLNEDKIKKVNEDMKKLALEKAKEQFIEAAVAQGMSEEMAETMSPTEIPFPEIEITKEMVSGVLKGQNFNMPAGYIKDEGTDYLVRTGDKLEDVEAIEELPILSTELMTATIEDVADIEIINASENSYAKVNGEDSIMISIQKQNNAVTTEVAHAVEDEIAKILDEYEGSESVMLMNQAEYIDMSIKSITNNLLYGALLAIIVLILFLRDLKPTFIIALAIPISVMTAFIMMYFAGISLNIISMGGLALGIGMLVDNSIVVIENIYRMRNDGVGAVEAALKGSTQVAGAIVASTLTTISVFIPVVFMEGFTAQIFMEMALTITFSLIASLVIALSLVPMMASKMMSKPQKEREHKVLDKVKIGYTKALKFSLKHGILVMLVVFVLFGASIYGAYSNGAELFPESDQGQISVQVNMPKGTEFKKTAEAVDEVSESIADIAGVENVSYYLSEEASVQALFTGGGSNAATINILLDDDRQKTTKEIAQDIREKTDELGYEVVVSEQAMDLSAMASSGISIEIKGAELDTLEKIALDITSIVEKEEGTTEIDSGVSKTSPELKIEIDREKSIEKGLTTAQVFAQVRELIGAEDKTSTLSVNGLERDIYVYGTEKEEVVIDIETIKNLELESPISEELVKIEDIAKIDTQSGFAKINRDNQSRAITITSAIEDGYNVKLVGAEIENKIAEYEVPEGYTVEFKGETADIEKSMGDLMKALLLALVLIYMIMASQFQSLIFPLIVMFSIPLAFTGGFLALLMTNTPISMISFVGLIILAGIVVNNGIVLVDYINQLVGEGKPLQEAIVEAGNTRLRPIIMTALTTILALVTMAIGVGEGSEMMQPMAITAIGGLIYATILTLVVVPVMYKGFYKLRRK